MSRYDKTHETQSKGNHRVDSTARTERAGSCASQQQSKDTAKNRNSSGGLTPWSKGQSGNPKGRPAGVPNKATGEAKAFLVQLVNDPLYQKKFREAFVNRRLKPQVEILVWHYAVGRPKVEVATDSGGTLADILDRMAAESGL